MISHACKFCHPSLPALREPDSPGLPTQGRILNVQPVFKGETTVMKGLLNNLEQKTETTFRGAEVMVDRSGPRCGCIAHLVSEYSHTSSSLQLFPYMEFEQCSNMTIFYWEAEGSCQRIPLMPSYQPTLSFLSVTLLFIVLIQSSLLCIDFFLFFFFFSRRMFHLLSSSILLPTLISLVLQQLCLLFCISIFA